MEKEKTFLGVFHAKGLEGTKVGLLELEAKMLKQQKEGKEKEANEDYLEGRRRDRRDVHAYLEEAGRRVARLRPTALAR